MSRARLARQYGLVDPGRVGGRAGAELAAEAAPAKAPSPAEAGEGWGGVAWARAMPVDSCTGSNATPSQPPPAFAGGGAEARARGCIRSYKSIAAKQCGLAILWEARKCVEQGRSVAVSV